MASRKEVYAMNPGDNAALDVMRKVIGLGVRCMEEHGAPIRKLIIPVSND